MAFFTEPVDKGGKWGFTREICLTTKDPGNIIYKSVIVRKCEPKSPGEHLNYIEKQSRKEQRPDIRGLKLFAFY